MIDESGFMPQPVVRRTWAPAGQTPLLVPSAKHDRWSIITALTVSPDRQRLGLYFQGFAENITGEHCELFVWAIHQQVRRPLLVVWDGLSAHATAANALRDKGERIVFERFPAYSPQLNPVEFAARWKLSDRQHDCVRLLAYGVPQFDLADRLGVSPRAVDEHLRKVRDRCGEVESCGLIQRLLELAIEAALRREHGWLGRLGEGA